VNHSNKGFLPRVLCLAKPIRHCLAACAVLFPVHGAEVDLTPVSAGDGAYTEVTVAGQQAWQNTDTERFLYCPRPDSFAPAAPSTKHKEPGTRRSRQKSCHQKRRRTPAKTRKKFKNCRVKSAMFLVPADFRKDPTCLPTPHSAEGGQFDAMEVTPVSPVCTVSRPRWNGTPGCLEPRAGALV
jgi:hypothetical protein